MTDLLGNGYWVITEENTTVGETLTDLIILDCLEEPKVLIAGTDASYNTMKSGYDFLKDQLFMMKRVYLYERHPLLVAWISHYVKYNKLECEVWVNINDDCWCEVE